MRVLVCGGRDYGVGRAHAKVMERTNLVLYLDGLDGNLDISCIIHGGARGADAIAATWAKDCGVTCSVYAADWKTYGRAAGPMRNARMLDEGKPDLVIAFPGGKGTADMVRRARKAGVPVREVE